MKKKPQPHNDCPDIQRMFDHLKMSYLIQGRELLKIKRENEQLHQKLSSYESLVSSITQNTITKQEMKDILKEELLPVMSILQGQETEMTQTKKEIADALSEVKNEQLKQSIMLQKEVKKDKPTDGYDNGYETKREEPTYEAEIKPRPSVPQETKKEHTIFEFEEVSDNLRFSVQPSLRKEDPKSEFKKVTQAKLQPNELSKSSIITEKKNKVTEIIISAELDTSFDGIMSLVETEDKRIASGGQDGNITVSSYDVIAKTWTKDIYRTNAHDGDSISSLCALSGNRLVSAGGSSIKVWSVAKANLKPIKQIFEHKCTVCKVIPLYKERIASCSRDKTVRIIKDDKKFTLLTTLNHDNYVNSILHLKKKDILVSCGTFSKTGITFWTLDKYSKKGNVKGYGVTNPTHATELANGNIALSVK